MAFFDLGLGDVVSAGTKLIGGSMASDATKAANAQAQRNFEQQQRTADAQRDQDYQRQEHFAKHGVQWRAEDARQAGIHPLYALGGNFATYSGSPVTVGAPSITPDTSMGSAVASMGQDIGRAINATRTGTQRDDAFTQTVQGLTLQKMGLENTLLASQIKRLQANSNPAFPSVQAPGSAADKDKLSFAGIDLNQTKDSPAEAWENRHGEVAGDLMGALIAFRDWQNTAGGSLDTSSWPAAVSNAVARGISWLDQNIKVAPGSFAGAREWVPNSMRAPRYRTGTMKYGPR